MNRVVLGLAIALVGSNVVWAFLRFDAAVTADYMQVEMQHSRDVVNVATALTVALARPTTARETGAILANRFPNYVVKTYGDTVEVEGLFVVHDSTHIVSVAPLEPDPR